MAKQIKNGKRNGKHPRITREFRDILPGLSDNEFLTLEKDILKRGILQPVLTWNGICVDGMHRLKIAKKHNLPYPTKALKFKDKQDAKAWIFEHQIGRRNQSVFGKIVAGLQFEEYYSRLAKENQRKSHGRGKKGFPIVGKPYDTAGIISKKVGVARSYVGDVKYILKHGTKDLIQKCHLGEVSIRNAYFDAKEQELKKKRNMIISKQGRFINPKSEQYFNQIIKGDCLEVMPKMIKNGLAGKISNIICSPPYNCDKNYGKNHNDNLPYEDYLHWLGKVIRLSSKLLRKGGRLIWVVAEVANRRTSPNDDSYCHTIYPDLISMVRKMKNGLKFRDCIIWNKANFSLRNTAFGSYRSPSNVILRSNHEYVLIWSKDQWDMPNITGQEPDITKKEFLEWTYSVWTIMQSSSKKINHPAVYAEELVKRLIKLYSYPGDLIADIFVGSGTTTAVAAELGRNYIGIEQNGSYCKYAKERTEKAYKKWVGKKRKGEVG